MIDFCSECRAPYPILREIPLVIQKLLHYWGTWTETGLICVATITEIWVFCWWRKKKTVYVSGWQPSFWRPESCGVCLCGIANVSSVCHFIENVFLKLVIVARWTDLSNSSSSPTEQVNVSHTSTFCFNRSSSQEKYNPTTQASLRHKYNLFLSSYLCLLPVSKWTLRVPTVDQRNYVILVWQSLLLHFWCNINQS